MTRPRGAASVEHGTGAVCDRRLLWRFGISGDLVVINAELTSYLMALQPERVALRERHAADSAAQGGSPSTGLHVLRAEELSADELGTLQALARVRLLADGRPLLHHLQEWLVLLHLAVPGAPLGPPDAGTGLSHRALRDGGRRLGAHLLHVGEALDWSVLTGEHSFVIELPQARAQTPPGVTATLQP